MANNRKGRRRATTAKVKVSAKKLMHGSVKAKFHRPKYTMDTIRDNWDPTKSPADNLASIGLASDVNADVVGRAASASAAGDGKGKVCEFFDIPDSDSLVDVNPKRRAQPMLENDQRYVSKLMAKHGEDYEKMARDIKTNAKQLTASRLQKMCARFKLLDDAQRLAPLPMV